ncbi:MAG: cytochrome C [Rhodospirillaceae bacterium]|nr:cytochrome C [Rhodospirillaceae bacterium]
MTRAEIKGTLAALAVVTLALVGAALWAWYDGNRGPAEIHLRPDDAQAVARGEAIYQEQCAVCHGANLEGQANWRERLPTGRLPAPPHDRTGHTWHHPDAQLFDITKRGPAAVVGGGYESDMPGFADVLSDDDIIAVLSYIKSTWPDEVRRRHDLINGPQ